MSAPQSIPALALSTAIEELRQQAHQRLDEIIASASGWTGPRLPRLRDGPAGAPAVAGMPADPALPPARHDRLDPAAWQARGYRVATPPPSGRSRPVAGRSPMSGPSSCRGEGGGPGVHPLDVALGLTRDAYSPLVIGWFCRLATRVSFRVASGLGGMFLGGAAGLGDRGVGPGPGPARLRLPQRGPLARGRRRGAGHRDRRQGGPHGHRAGTGAAAARGRHAARAWQVPAASGPGERQRRGRKKRRKKGDKSKNGRSATLVVMYTLRRGEDGRLHGPVNKKVFGTFGSRKSALDWARAQATRRGFPPGPPRRCRSSSTARRAWSSGCGGCSAGDPDAGRAARAGEALGGGPAVPPRRERRVGGLGRGVGGVALQGACAELAGAAGAGDGPGGPRGPGTKERRKKLKRGASATWRRG